MKENFKKESPLLGLEGSGGGLGFFGGATADPTYVDNVFSTFLYDGSASAQTITNGIDLSGEGGMVWLKSRSGGYNHNLYDTERGVKKAIYPNTSGTEYTENNSIGTFNNNGFTFAGGGDAGFNTASAEFVSWTFRKAPGFFDVVTWTGNGVNGRQIAHNLGSTPGMSIIKCLTTNSRDWIVRHENMSSGKVCFLNEDYGELENGGGYQTHSSTHLTLNSGSAGLLGINNTGDNYVAYVFGHNDASFGTDSDEAIIKCGTFTTDSGGLFDVNLGFEPQWVVLKRKDAAGDWSIIDQTREWGNLALERALGNTAQAPFTNEYEGYLLPYSRGFKSTTSFFGGSQNFIYMAIRRPHKPPTAGTEVFDVGLRSGSSSDAKTNSDIFTDMTFVLRKDSSSEYNGIASRITNRNSLKTTNTDSENTGWLDTDTPWAYMTGAMVNGGNGASNTGNLIDFSFKRAPGFFDVVAYTGTGSSRNLSHNLEAAPELIITKRRGGSGNWFVFANAVTSPNSDWYLNNGYLNLDWELENPSGTSGISGSPTSTVIPMGNSSAINGSSNRYVMYLFASLDGISKVGSYTGTGNNINVDCGFSAGARFILIKRIDSANTDWYVFNTASGIASGNDPYMLLNEQDQEVTNTDYIDPLNAGFTVTSSAPAALNTSSGKYLFLAIA